MSYENLRPANFMKCIPGREQGSGNFQATDIRPVDQAALHHQIDAKERARAAARGEGVGPLIAHVPEDWERRFRLIRQTQRRGERGGMNLDRKDAPEKY